MKKWEIEEKIDELKTRRFYLKMADHWTARDFETDTKLYNEIKKLEAMLEK